MPTLKLKKGDRVVMLAGREKGKETTVVRTYPGLSKVLLEGLNVVKRHTKASSKNPRSGIQEIPKPVPAGKVALICPSCKKPTRIGYQIKGDQKERFCRKCKGVLK